MYRADRGFYTRMLHVLYAVLLRVFDVKYEEEIEYA